MRKKLFAIAMTGIFLFFSLSIFAQSKTVTGTVTDKDGPVAGASVVVKGSNLGTNTDANGAFSISVPASARTLVISFVGLAPQEVSIGDGPVSVVMGDATRATPRTSSRYLNAKLKAKSMPEIAIPPANPAADAGVSSADTADSAVRAAFGAPGQWLPQFTGKKRRTGANLR